MTDNDRTAFDALIERALHSAPPPDPAARRATMDAARSEVHALYAKPSRTQRKSYVMIATAAMLAMCAMWMVWSRQPKPHSSTGAVAQVSPSSEDNNESMIADTTHRAVMDVRSQDTTNPALSENVTRGNLLRDTPNAADTMPHRVAGTIPDTGTAPMQNAPPRHTPAAPPALQKSYASVVQGLSPATAGRITPLFDHLTQHGISTAPLAARVREGVQRRVPEERILVVARNYVSALDTTLAALGAATSPTDILLGAEAVLAGTSGDGLRALRTARATGALSEPLLALTDLATHGVPPQRASAALAALVAGGGSDASVRALRAEVVASIVKGVSPDVALARSIQDHGVNPIPSPRPEPSLDSLKRQQRVP